MSQQSNIPSFKVLSLLSAIPDYTKFTFVIITAYVPKILNI